MSAKRVSAFACAFALASSLTLHASADPDVQKRPPGDDAARAERLFTEAKKLVREGRHAEACMKLEESEHLDSALGTQFNLADCYEHTGRLARAWTVFTRVGAIARAAGKRDRERAALERASALELKLAKITLSVKDAVPGLVVQRDGVAWPRDSGQPEMVDPGPVSVTASAPGRKDFATRIVLVAGEARTIEIPMLEPSAPPPPPAPLAPGPAGDGEGLRGQQLAAIAAGGAGVVALAVGSVFGIVALTKHDEAKSVCPDPSACSDRTAATTWTDATAAGKIATIGFVVGIVALGAGAVLWFTSPKGRAVAYRPGGGELTLRW